MTTRPVLVVEDNAATRKMLRVALEVEGYVVLDAEDGASALRLATEHRPGLVLLDCRLPDFDGFELARMLREQLPDVPLVAVTGWTQMDESRVLSSGFADVLIKPVDPTRLLEVVGNYFARELPHTERAERTVLLIDDDPVQLKLSALAFAYAGFEVVQAADGESGLQAARRVKPHLIVSDVLMPGVDGFQVCDRIRRDPELRHVPLVLTSAHYLEDEDRALAARFGASAYVSRSFGFDQVVSAALRALEVDAPNGSIPPPDALQSEYLRRIAHQLERQAALNASLAQRASIQATALSVLEGISDALAGQLDPESALEDTLTRCLDSAGLSVGAILMQTPRGDLKVKAHVGAGEAGQLERFGDVLHLALARESLVVPSTDTGTRGLEMLRALGVEAAIVVPIVARYEALGVLVLASNRPDFATLDGTSLVRAARSVSMQLGQALAVSRVFSRLTAAEQRYRALLDNASDAIAISSAEGRVLEVNRRFESLFGRSRQQLIGREIAELAPNAQVPLGLRPQGAAGEHTQLIEPVLIRRPDGGHSHVEFSSAEMDIGGERVVLAIGRDVSDRLRLAEQLRQAQKMEAIGRLAGGVAHDMNNVLAAVLAYSQFLIEALSPSDPRRGDAEEIRDAAQRGASLTRQLLTFSRQQTNQPRNLDLNEVVQHLLKMLRTIIGEDVEIEARLASDLPNVNVDAGQIEQVLMNLAVNSRDAMPKGGRLTISTSWSGQRVTLAVTDTGTGIAEDVLQHMFEPFFTTKEPGKGTGLGLATVFGIVKQSGGEVEVDSKPGAGTTFSVLLPIGSEQRPSRPKQPVGAPQLGHETLLLVEDDDALRSALVRTLERHGYHVLAAKTGVDAIALSERASGPIQLVVTDVVLPQMSGPDAVAEIRKRFPQAKVLYISGYTDTTAYRDVPVNGPGFFQKPFSPDAFAARVRTALDAGEG